jgi:hypothetical protein
VEDPSAPIPEGITSELGWSITETWFDQDTGVAIES